MYLFILTICLDWNKRLLLCYQTFLLCISENGFKHKIIKFRKILLVGERIDFQAFN